MRLGCGNSGSKDVGGESSRGLIVCGSFFDAIADDEGSGGKIAKPLVIFGNEDGNGPDGVEKRDLVDVANEVASHGFEEADGAAGALDDTDSSHTLTGGTAVPESFEERKVTPVEEEDEKEEHQFLNLIYESCNFYFYIYFM